MAGVAIVPAPRARGGMPRRSLRQVLDWRRKATVQTLLWILLATLAGGVLSVLIAALFALSLLRRWVPQLVSYAVGVLLAAAFLDILPELSASGLPATPAFATVLGGMMGFFVLEKFAHWHHAHGAHDLAHEPTRPAGFMILLGDALHSLVDGVLLAAAFLHDPRLGLVTTAAIVGHEIPHKVGDFMVLLDSGYDRTRALRLNVLASLTAIAGGVLGYFALLQAQAAIPYALAIAAASFIYIAAADLVPSLHRRTDMSSLLSQSGLLAAGVATVAVQMALLEH
jgi:zinc and cadmium transporter